MFDGLLFLNLTGLAYIVSSPGFSTIYNLFYQTSEGIKFKERKIKEANKRKK